MRYVDILIFRKILLSCPIRNVWRTERRMCIFVLGLIERVKGLAKKGIL